MKTILCLLFFLTSCASLRSGGSQALPMYLSQDSDTYYINIVFEKIPQHTFLLDGQEVHHDSIKYKKLSFGHLTQIPITLQNSIFEIKSGLSTLAHRNIKLKESPKKLMMFSSFSPPLYQRINEENPDTLIIFIPPSNQYQDTLDFLKSELFQSSTIRLMHLVGEKEIENSLNFPEFSILALKDIHKSKKPSMISHYSTLTNLQNEKDFQELSQELKRLNIPLVFLSSNSKNLIQQIPKAHFGFPSYEFSVKNQFLTFAEHNPSAWEVLNEFNSDYFLLEIDFSDSYWHILLQGKDEKGSKIFERDLTLYETKLR